MRTLRRLAIVAWLCGVGVALVCLGLTLLTSRFGGPQPGQTMRDVLGAERRAGRASVAIGTATSISGFPVPLTNFDWPGYFDKLHRVDVGACPRDFRLAWFDYVQSCEQAGVNNLEFPVSLASGNRKRGWVAPVDTVAPWQRVQSITARY
jgi:hypothetical protein